MLKGDKVKVISGKIQKQRRCNSALPSKEVKLLLKVDMMFQNINALLRNQGQKAQWIEVVPMPITP